MESGRGWSPPALGPVVPVTPVGGVILYVGRLSDDQVRAVIVAQGWLPCDGALYAVPAYPMLFSVLGYTYGGEAGNFGVPDLSASIVSVPGAEQNYLIRYR